MNELVFKVVDVVGFEFVVVEKVIGFMFFFLKKEGDDQVVFVMIVVIFGVEELVVLQNGGGGFFGGLFGGGIMVFGQQLMSVGFGMGEIILFVKEIMLVVCQYVGDQVVDDVIVLVLGFSQFV